MFLFDFLTLAQNTHYARPKVEKLSQVDINDFSPGPFARWKRKNLSHIKLQGGERHVSNFHDKKSMNSHWDHNICSVFTQSMCVSATLQATYILGCLFFVYIWSTLLSVFSMNLLYFVLRMFRIFAAFCFWSYTIWLSADIHEMWRFISVLLLNNDRVGTLNTLFGGFLFVCLFLLRDLSFGTVLN